MARDDLAPGDLAPGDRIVLLEASASIEEVHSRVVAAYRKAFAG